MRKLFFVCFFCQVIILSAQIQITQSHLPSLADTARYSSSSSFNLNFTTNGANHKWDYSNLNTTEQGIYNFQSVLQTPYALLSAMGLPFGAMGYKIADSLGTAQFSLKNIYNFYEKKSTVWQAVGTGFTLSLLPIPAGGIYNDKDEIYQLPLNYNDIDSNTFEVSTPIGNQVLKLGTYKQKGKRWTHVEGWGEISTPFGNNISCLKIKSVITEIDSLKLTTPSVNIGFPANRVEYKWLSTTQKIPILEVIGTEINGNFTPNQIRFRDNYRAPSTNNPNYLKANFKVNQTVGIQYKDTFVFTNTTQPNIGSTYTWNFTPSIGVRYIGSDSNSASPKLVFDSVGTYTVKLLAKNFNTQKDTIANNLITILRDNSNGIVSANTKQLTLQHHPNPAQDYLYIDYPYELGLNVRFFDLNGRLVHNTNLDSNLKIDIQTLNSGQYIMVLFNGINSYLSHTQITIE